MANRVRGVRQTVKNNTLVGRLNSGGNGPVQQIDLNDIAVALLNAGISPVPGPGGGASPAGSTHAIQAKASSTTFEGIGPLTDGQLVVGQTGAASLAKTMSGDATLSASGAVTIGNNKIVTAYINAAAVIYAKIQNGASNGLLGVNSGAAPTEVAVGSGLSLSGGTLSATGGGGTTISDAGAWNSAIGYTAGQCVQYNGSAYLCYSDVSAPTDVAAKWDSAAAAPFMSVTTTVTTDDTAVSLIGGGTNNQYVISAGDSKSSGQWYYEVGISGWFDSGTQFGASSSNYPSGGGGIAAALNNALSSTFSGGGSGSWTFAQPKRAALAVDLDTNLFWFTPDVTAGTIAWNGSSSNSPDVGSQVGGIATGTHGTVFKWFYGQGHVGQTTQLFTRGADLLIPSVPTGYAPWVLTAGTANVSPDLDFNHWVGQGNSATYLVADLPTPSIAGRRLFVSDALAPAFGSTVVGSGAVTVPVFDDGSNWVVG